MEGALDVGGGVLVLWRVPPGVPGVPAELVRLDGTHVVGVVVPDGATESVEVNFVFVPNGVREREAAPRLGRMIIWPNVWSAEPSSQDNRMMHEARPVAAGVKYGVNVWLRNYPDNEDQLDPRLLCAACLLLS